MGKDAFSRRDVLRGLGGLALVPALPAHALRRSGGGPSFSIAAVANRPRTVAGLEAYAQKSVAAGDAVDFRVSSPYPGPHRFSLVRLGWDTELKTKDWILGSVELPAPGEQPIRPGSYVHVENALDPSASIAAFTVECWVRPYRGPGNYGPQGLVAQYSDYDRCGFALSIDVAGRLSAYFGDGSWFRPEWRRSSPTGLQHLEWQHVAATFDGGTVALYVGGFQVDQGVLSGLTAFVPGPAPFRIGALGDATGTGFFLDGDIAMPAIYQRALGPSEIAARAQVQEPPHVPWDGSLLGCWPLDEEWGSTVDDASACGRTGLTVNRGTWMIGGPTFDAESVPETYDPDADPMRGHGLRLSGSDLFDCGWPVAHSATVPADCPPGVYVGRIETEGHAYDVTFVVRRAEDRPPAPVLVLCATNTWLAYNKSLDLFSFYDDHEGTQPAYHQGFEMPWSNPVPYGRLRSDADPYVTYSHTPGYSHLVRAERFLHVWLEQNGYDYDLIGDRELHATAEILDRYKVLIVAGHSEYWTRESQDKVQAFVEAGGCLITLSGNTMFWRVTTDDVRLECRKPPTSLGGSSNAKRGEIYHERDHALGGWLRQDGAPEWQITGLESVGFDGTHVPYLVTDPAHAFFQGPESIPVAPTSGAPVELGGPLAVGHEWDVSLSRIQGHGLTGPAVNVLAQAQGDGTQTCFNYALESIPSAGAVISEIVEWTHGAGRVFSVGSIAAGQSLHADKKMAALLRNVLHHFGVASRVHGTALGKDGRLVETDFDGSSWSAFAADAWTGFGIHPPTIVACGANSLASLAVTAAGGLRFRMWSGRRRSTWSEIGQGLALQGRPAAVAWGRNRLDVWVRDASGHMLHRARNGSAWSPWADLGDAFTSEPAAAAWEGNRLSVAALDANGRVLYREFAGGTWGPSWRNMSGSFTRAPTMLAWGGERLSLGCVDATGRLWWKTRSQGRWTPSFVGWQDLGTPSPAGLAGRVHVVVTGHDQSLGRDTLSLFGIGTDGRLKVKWWDGTQWGPSTTGWVDLGGSLVGEPAVASYRGGRVTVLAVGTDAQLWRLDWNGTAWSAWQAMGGSLSATPAIAPWLRVDPGRFVQSDG